MKTVLRTKLTTIVEKLNRIQEDIDLTEEAIKSIFGKPIASEDLSTFRVAFTGDFVSTKIQIGNLNVESTYYEIGVYFGNNATKFLFHLIPCYFETNNNVILHLKYGDNIIESFSLDREQKMFKDLSAEFVFSRIVDAIHARL